MIHSTVGILLKNIKHSDSSAVIQVFTREFGRKSYFIRGLSRKKNSPRSLLFPMAILELQVTERENKTIQQVRDISIHKPTATLISDPLKSSVALFLNEILVKSIEQDYQNEVLYDFLENAIQVLDITPNVKNFHIWFMLELSKHFGFYPRKEKNTSARGKTFDMESGLFLKDDIHTGLYLQEDLTTVLWDILGMNFDELSSYEIHSEKRKKLLRALVEYFKIHVPNLNRVVSLDVLETVFEF